MILFSFFVVKGLKVFRVDICCIFVSKRPHWMSRWHKSLVPQYNVQFIFLCECSKCLSQSIICGVNCHENNFLKRMFFCYDFGAKFLFFCAVVLQAYAELLEEENIKIPAWFSFNSKDGVNVVSGDSLLECASIAESCKQVVSVGINCTPPRFISGLILIIKKVRFCASNLPLTILDSIHACQLQIVEIVTYLFLFVFLYSSTYFYNSF